MLDRVLSHGRAALALALTVLGAAGCSDSEGQGRADFFTFQVAPENGIFTPTSGTYYYIPVDEVTTSPGPGGSCEFRIVNFVGRAQASAGGGSTRVGDQADQGETTSADYLVRPEDGSLCGGENSFVSQFTYDGVRYFVTGEILIPFADYQSLVPSSNFWIESCVEYVGASSVTWGTTTSTNVCFWPYEYAPQP